MTRLRLLPAILLVTCAIVPAARTQEPKPDVPAQYAATAFGEAGAAAGKSFGLNIYLDSVTSDADIQELVGILRKEWPVRSRQRHGKNEGRWSHRSLMR